MLEGNWKAHRVVIIRFDDAERARAMYESPEYQAAREKRLGAADFNMLVVDGL